MSDDDLHGPPARYGWIWRCDDDCMCSHGVIAESGPGPRYVRWIWEGTWYSEPSESEMDERDAELREACLRLGAINQEE